MSLRDAFPVLKHRAYLNAGTNGPMPGAAADAMARIVDQGVRDGRGALPWFEAARAAREAQRAAYARAIGAREAEEVALTTSTSEGIVRVLAGLEWSEGDEVVTAEDEHPGLLGPLATLRGRRGVTVRAVPLADVAAAVGPRTRLVACSHVSWVSGALAPVDELREAGVPVLLDGAQGAGAIDVDVWALSCDFYAAAGQKWLCGPGGTGLLWVRPGSACAPIGATYANLAEPGAGLDAQPWPDARAHDLPAFDPVLGVGAAAAAEVLLDDPGRVARAVALAEQLADRLRERGLVVAPRGATTLVSWEQPDPAAAVARLAEGDVVVRDLPGTPYLRASVGGWTSEEDLERLLVAL
jgi:L-cysteine/cystine lyase